MGVLTDLVSALAAKLPGKEALLDEADVLKESLLQIKEQIIRVVQNGPCCDVRRCGSEVYGAVPSRLSSLQAGAAHPYFQCNGCPTRKLQKRKQPNIRVLSALELPQ